MLDLLQIRRDLFIPELVGGLGDRPMLLGEHLGPRLITRVVDAGRVFALQFLDQFA